MSNRTGKKTLFFLTMIISIIICLMFLFYGYEKTWKLWNVPALMHPFADVIIITSGAESHALGYDPLFYNPQNPFKNQMNYPRIWQCIFALGINKSHTIYIGSFLIILFFLGIFMALNEIDNFTAVVLSIIIFSPAVMLGLERGNNDLFIFFILSIALVIGRNSALVSLPLILFASILKVYPIFGLGYLLKESKKRFLYLLLFSCCIFLIYIIFTWDDLVQIKKVTFRGVTPSYGINVFSMWVRNLSGSKFMGKVALGLSYLIIILIFITSLAISYKNQKSLIIKEGRHIDAFRLGAGIYLGTFMILGNNWDYRLMFLIFTIPQLIVWRNQKATDLLFVSKLTLLAIIISCWGLMIERPFHLIDHLFNNFLGSYLYFLFDEFSNWIVFAGLIYLLIYSMPDWLRCHINQVISLMPIKFVSRSKNTERQR